MSYLAKSFSMLLSDVLKQTSTVGKLMRYPSTVMFMRSSNISKMALHFCRARLQQDAIYKGPMVDFLPILHFHFLYFMSNYRESQREIKPPREGPQEGNVMACSTQSRKMFCIKSTINKTARCFIINHSFTDSVKLGFSKALFFIEQLEQTSSPNGKLQTSKVATCESIW